MYAHYLRPTEIVNTVSNRLPNPSRSLVAIMPPLYILLFISAGGIAAVLVLAFRLQWMPSRAAGAQPELLILGIDPQTGLAGGLDADIGVLYGVIAVGYVALLLWTASCA
jgi:hypothetical protein